MPLILREPDSLHCTGSFSSSPARTFKLDIPIYAPSPTEDVDDHSKVKPHEWKAYGYYARPYLNGIYCPNSRMFSFSSVAIYLILMCYDFSCCKRKINHDLCPERDHRQRSYRRRCRTPRTLGSRAQTPFITRSTHPLEPPTARRTTPISLGSSAQPTPHPPSLGPFTTLLVPCIRSCHRKRPTRTRTLRLVPLRCRLRTTRHLALPHAYALQRRIRRRGSHLSLALHGGERARHQSGRCVE